MQSEIYETENKKSINKTNEVQREDINVATSNDEDFDNLYDTEEDSFSSPSTNSGDDIRWYGRLGINFMEANVPNNVNDYHLHIEHPQNVPPDDEEDETDFLEMDFEPDTNSEIENEARFNNYDMRNNHENQLPSDPQNHLDDNVNNFPNFHNNRNTGAKPKQFSACRSSKSNRHNNSQQISDGDDTFKVTGQLYVDTSKSRESPYNVGASCSRYSLNNERQYRTKSNSHFMMPFKSPSKSSSHNYKQERLHEEQNDQFLLEIEPIKPRNSITIYTSNCDEKILIDSLTSLNLKPDREIISNYFNNTKATDGYGLIDYIIHVSKKKCNYLKLVELIEESCLNEYYDEYGTKRFDINFYPLDFFSTIPEMVDVEVSELIKRWTPQTDLTPLITIKNKYFIQTNVLGKLVNVIRKFNNTNNQKLPSHVFRDDSCSAIKIPQFYVSGYITLTTRHITTRT